MSRVCQITGRKTRTGRLYARRGLEKRKGGVGKKTTGRTKRKFKINLQWKSLWVPELKRNVRVRLSTRALRTITKKGLYSGLLEAGVVQAPRRHKRGKTKPAAASS
jgi:large subunit ribosomal protein L28